MELYPLKFDPIYKTKIWGGNRLKNILEKDTGELNNVGESWELSCVPNELSVISNGYLKGINIENAIKEFRSKLLGEKVYNKFGNSFPLLIKFIDANDYLSIQVHPDDDMAIQRHNSFGKTEMWYVVDAEKDAELIVGFNQDMDKGKYLKHMDQGSLRSVLNFEKVQVGDVFHLPAGRIHATGPGILFAEIQQTSDLTYRIYDWDRKDEEGNERELHTELARDAIDFTSVDAFKTEYQSVASQSNSIVQCSYFTANFIVITTILTKDYSKIDSFVILMAMEGQTSISYSTGETPVLLNKGETILIPASVNEITLITELQDSKLLEVYV